MTSRLGIEHVTTREIPLSDEDITKYQREMAALYERREKAEIEIKQSKKLAKQRVDGMSERLSSLAVAISTKKEKRETVVVWRTCDDDPGIAELVEVRGGNVLERRPLDPDERQRSIDDYIKPPTTIEEAIEQEAAQVAKVLNETITGAQAIKDESAADWEANST